MRKEKVYSHGKYAMVGIAEARKRNGDAKKLVSDGKNPTVEKRLARIHAETKARITFLQVRGLQERNCGPHTRFCSGRQNLRRADEQSQ